MVNQSRVPKGLIEAMWFAGKQQLLLRGSRGLGRLRRLPQGWQRSLRRNWVLRSRPKEVEEVEKDVYYIIRNEHQQGFILEEELLEKKIQSQAEVLL